MLLWFGFILLFQTIGNIKGCADIVFVLDGSASVKEQFQQMINVASKVAAQFDIQNKGHRIAILEYSGRAILSKWLQYRFDSIQRNSDFEKVMKNLRHIRGATDTGRALGIVLHEYLPDRRLGLPFIVFTITDGYFRDPEEVLKNVADLVAQPNVQLFVATASKPYNMRSLLLLVNNDSSHVAAGTDALSLSQNFLKPYTECVGLKIQGLPKKVPIPSESTATTTSRSFTITTSIPVINQHQYLRVQPNFTQILAIRNRTLTIFVTRTARIARTTTQTTTATTTTQTTTSKEDKNTVIRPECLLDIVFLMDFSDGASDKRQAYIDLVSTLIRELNLGQTLAQVAAIRYSGPKRSDTLFHLRKHSSAEAAIKEMQKAPSNGGTTRTGEAIQYAVGEFDEKYGGRKDAKKMLIIFTDGYSQDDPSDAAREARNNGIEVKAVAVEDENVPPDAEQIVTITGDPEALYLTKDFDKLRSLFAEYSRRCKV